MQATLSEAGGITQSPSSTSGREELGREPIHWIQLLPRKLPTVSQHSHSLSKKKDRQPKKSHLTPSRAEAQTQKLGTIVFFLERFQDGCYASSDDAK